MEDSKISQKGIVELGRIGLSQKVHPIAKVGCLEVGSPSCCWIEIAWLKDDEKKRKTLIKRSCTQKGNAFETTSKVIQVKHPGLFSEASSTHFEIVTSHNFDVLTEKHNSCLFNPFSQVPSSIVGRSFTIQQVTKVFDKLLIMHEQYVIYKHLGHQATDNFSYTKYNHIQS